MKEHCLIIGGTRGIGKETVNHMAQSGVHISVVGQHNTFKANSLPTSGIRYYAADITQETQLPVVLDKIVRTDGPLNHVVFFQRFRGDHCQWENEINTSLTATKNMIELLLDKFCNTGEKNIVVISSVAAELIAQEQGPAYHVAKAGLLQLTRYYAVILGERGIRVNCISPAIVLKDESAAYFYGNKQLTDLYKSITPLGRMGTSKDIANLVEFICSPKASFITGQNIIIDGGLTLQMQASLSVKNFLG